MERRQSNTHPGREEWIDSLRGAGLVLMMAGHCSIPDGLRTWIYGFHIPLFFILSGYLHNERKWSDKGWKAFLKARAVGYLVPYFLWCSICFVLNLPLLYVIHRDHYGETLVQNLIWILTSVRVDGLSLSLNCGALWFLPTLFLSQQVFYWLLKCSPLGQTAASVCFLLFNHLLQRYGVPILPWHLEVSLIGAILMLIGHQFKTCALLTRISSGTVAFILFLIAGGLALVNGAVGNVDLYYRNYGSFALLFLTAALTTFSLMWAFWKVPALSLWGSLTELGRYSIVVLGVHLTINRCAEGGFQILSALIPGGGEIPQRWALQTAINVVGCLIAIRIFKYASAKHGRLAILIGHSGS